MNLHLNHFTIKIGGQNIPEALYDSMVEVIVDSRLNMPVMFTLRFHDPELKWVDDSLLAIGKEVEILVSVDEEAATESAIAASVPVTKGEITAIEPDFVSDGEVSLVVRGYDKMHRLHRGRKSKTYVQVKDSDLFSQLVRESGLMVGTVDATPKVYDSIVQYNQTNMEFLMSRAERIGYQIYFSDGKLNYRKGDSFTSGDSLTLTYLENLTRFEPRWTASHQPDKVTVKGWDVIGKKEIQGTATPNSALNQGGMEKTGGELANSAFGAAEEIITEQPVYDQSEANAIAKGVSNEMSRGFVQAEGECSGHPKVIAGCKVTIKGVGKRFSGTYLVSAATQIYSPKGYITRFSISGERFDTLGSLLQDGSHTGQEHGQVTGIVTGIVTNLNDQKNLGRVKVKYAWLGEIESDWARLATPMAGKERGWMFLPEVNDEVVIAFEQGDINRPYILGAVWNNLDKPPKPNSAVVKGGKVAEHILKSRSGHLIILDDTEGSEQIIIRDKTGKNEIIIDSAKNTITINVGQDLKSSAKGETSIQSTGKMSFKSDSDFSIECMNFKVEAKANADLKANAAVNIQNAAAKIALSGPSVNINNGALEVI
jgi:phage protein D